VPPEGGKELPLVGWTWPEPFRVQSLIQQAAMQAVVARNDHVHEPQSKIHARIVAANHFLTVGEIGAPSVDHPSRAPRTSG
jgi:hypothetical protein